MNAKNMITKSNSKTKLYPAPGYLLIEPSDTQTKTLSGIYLPDSAGEKPQQGKVVAVGDDEVNDKGVKLKSPVSKSDVVIYKKWGGNEVKIDGIEYLFVKFEDILATVK
jgi:chaperonin GroES